MQRSHTVCIGFFVRREGDFIRTGLDAMDETEVSGERELNRHQVLHFLLQAAKLLQHGEYNKLERDADPDHPGWLIFA